MRLKITLLATRLGLALLLLSVFGSSHAVMSAQTPPDTTLSPVPHPATPAQIRQYLKISGELEAYRTRWVGALARNRSRGPAYWPESVWVEVKRRMESEDLTPLFITWYQHTVSTELMQQTLDTYQALGASHFQGSVAYFRLKGSQEPHQSDFNNLTLTNTLTLLKKVSVDYKPQIEAARAQYMVEHPAGKNN